MLLCSPLSLGKPSVYVARSTGPTRHVRTAAVPRSMHGTRVGGRTVDTNWAEMFLPENGGPPNDEEMAELVRGVVRSRCYVPLEVLAIDIVKLASGAFLCVWVCERICTHGLSRCMLIKLLLLC
jgi:hypothetical protein